MKKLNYILSFIIWLLFLFFICFTNSISHAANVENRRWSFAFTNCPISEALRQITKVTGIDIVINRDRGKDVLSKAYKDQTIEQILRDFFRKENYAIIWYCGSKGFDGIDILIFEGSSSGGSIGPEKIPRQRGANLKSNRIRKNKGYKSTFVRRKSEKTIGKDKAQESRQVSSPSAPGKIHRLERPPMPPVFSSEK